MKGTDDLEEAMSERLQELPPPLGRRNSQSKHDGEGFSFPQDMDTDAAGPSRVNQSVLRYTLSSSLCTRTSGYKAPVIAYTTAVHVAWFMSHVDWWV